MVSGAGMTRWKKGEVKHGPGGYARLPGAIVAAFAMGVGSAHAATLTSSTNSTPAGGSVNIGAVNAAAHSSTAAKALKKTDKKLTAKKIFHAAQSEILIGHDELQAAGPVGGAAGALAQSPGVRVVSSGAVGAQRAAISVNGIEQGWGGLQGLTSNGLLAVTFDGVPMNNPGSGLWATPQIPELSLISGINVIYGPGNPDSRWYDSLGGTIGFVPVQPTSRAGGNFGVTFGSYGTEGFHATIRTGLHDGYSAVLAAGTTQSNDYIQSQEDGFANPSHDQAIYGKVVKLLPHGNVGLGAYVADSRSYRPAFIPLAPIAGLTVNGFTSTGATIPGPLYSETTSGYYGGTPFSIWHKQVENATYLVYMPLNLHFSTVTALHNTLWYRHGNRLHNHYNDFNQGADNLFEYNNPHTATIGDKFVFDFTLPRNTVAAGGYYLYSVYNTRNAFYNPEVTSPSGIAYTYSYPSKYRSGYFYQNFAAAFVQDRIAIVRGLSATPGVRIAYFGTTYANLATTDFPQANLAYDPETQPNSSTTFTKVEPSLDIRYQWTRYLALYAQSSTAYQNPEVGGGGGPYQALPSSVLVPTEGRYDTAGLHVLVKHAGIARHFRMNLDYYHLSVTNQFINVTTSNGTSIEATGDSLYQGVNLSSEDNPVGGLHVFGNVGYERAHYVNYTTGGVAFAGLAVPYVPTETLTAGASYRYFRDGMVYDPKLWTTFTGSQNIFNNDTGAPSSQTLPAYNIWNASLGLVVPVGDTDGRADKMKVVFSILNLLNKRFNEYAYVTSGGYLGGNSAGATLGYPGAPRTYYVSADYSF
ncbi:TonB-dependent receptor [Acidiferrobacter sp.]|uniref:TonB-dependent receptor n=1 Tax=Acidiferrobacter sp. TaxID=1872107 RepID=UPI0026016403|nr:TonB-dependent receptor [Acidiferrobacter sp.]